MYKKVLLTQFGIPNLNTLEYKSNVHLAAGYLVGYVKEFLPQTEFIITPRIYTDLLTESTFIEYAVSKKPDLFVFSLYLWNIEKSLRVVKQIKKILPNAKFLFGGPEVNPDNRYLLESDQFCEGIVGEGEIAFRDYLLEKPIAEIAGYLTKDSYNDFISLRKDYKVDTNPYLANIIEIKPDNTMFFETVRGCPFSCNFCYYNKVYNKIIQVGYEHLDQIFEYARINKFNELFILDPTFNVQPHFDHLLDKMIELNSDHYFEISTELRADFLTDLQIEKLVKLNLVEAEIGLQTTNSKTLAVMGRKERTVETIKQTQKMIKAGISCKVDLIVGLPGDTLATFKQSIDDVKDADIARAMQVFKLSILSGTEFSKKRSELGITAEKMPPYYLLSTPSFTSSEIREALDYTEEVFDISLYPVPPYLLSTDFDNLDKEEFVEFDSNIQQIHKLILKSSEITPQEFESDLIKLCESLVVHFIITNPQKQELSIIDTLIWFSKNHPDNTYQFIVHFENSVDIELLENIIEVMPRGRSSYLSRDTIANLGEDLSLTSSLAVIVPLEFQNAEKYLELKEQCDIFLHMKKINKELLVTTVEEDNFFFSGEEQKEIFEFLSKKNLLDDFMLFDSYLFEMNKGDNEHARIYNPHTLII